MSPNLGFGLFDRSIGRCSLARQTSTPISPQDLDHTFVAAKVANNDFLVKLTNGPFNIHLPISGAVHLPRVR